MFSFLINDIYALNFSFSILGHHLRTLCILYIITLCLQYTTDVYCLISCHGSQLRGYVSSVHAMKHLPGLLTLAMEKGIQTMSLSMERKDLLDVSVLPAFNTSTIR